MLFNAILVGCGGFVGAALRYLCSVLLGAVDAGGFPLATFCINFAGSFLMGALSVALPSAFPGNSRLLLFATTGVLGGFTTFSTFSLETFGLMEEARWGMAAAYAAGSLAVCIAGVAAGRLLARAVVAA